MVVGFADVDLHPQFVGDFAASSQRLSVFFNRSIVSI